MSADVIAGKVIHPAVAVEVLTRYVLRLGWLAFAVWAWSEVMTFAYWLAR